MVLGSIQGLQNVANDLYPISLPKDASRVTNCTLKASRKNMVRNFLVYINHFNE